MGGRWKIPVILSTLREQWVWLHLRPNVQVINSRQCANSSCCISARTCEYVLNTIYSNNIFIGTSSYRISLARCCGGYLLSLSAMLWTAISSAVAAAAAAVLEMLSLAMFPIATLGIFEFPPKKVLDQNISNHYKNHCSPLLPTITHYYINYYYSLHPSTIPSSFLLPVAWTCDEDQRCQKSKVGHNERLLPLGFPRVFLISKMKRYDYWFRYNIDRIIHIFIYIIVHMIIYTYFYI